MAASLYQQILDLSAPYFPSVGDADRFLQRQCKSHLNCDPQKLGPHDLWNLSKWVEISGGLFIGRDNASRLKAQILEMRKSMSNVGTRDRLSGGDFSM